MRNWTLFNWVAFFFYTINAFSCIAYQQDFPDETLKEIWAEDECGQSGCRKVIAELITKEFYKRRMTDLNLMQSILGKPNKVTEDSTRTIYSYIVEGYDCDVAPYEVSAEKELVIIVNKKRPRRIASVGYFILN